jgi:hypothetical protein
MRTLVHDVLWREGNDLGVPGAHHHRGDGRVIIQGVPVRELTGETVRALDGLGGKVGCPIQGHQELIPEDTETVEQVGGGKVLKDLNKGGIEKARGNGIEERANLIVTGNLAHPKQGLGVIAPLGVISNIIRVLVRFW